MIKNLQRKFIIITMGSLFGVMLVLVCAISVVNLYQMDDNANRALELLSENQGKFPEFEKGKPYHDYEEGRFPIDAETQFKTRYFIVTVNQDYMQQLETTASDLSSNDIMLLDTTHSAVSSDDAVVYANKILSTGKQSGYIGIYKYAIFEQEEGSMILFLDCKDEIRTTVSFLTNSSGVALATILMMFLLISIFSKRAIKPIIDSMEKQKQFITDAGHEIKTPLAIISANADVLELTGGKSEWITSIRNQTSRLDKLVRNLLTLSKIDEGSIKMEFSEFDLSETVGETAASFEAVAESQKKSFQMDIQEGLKFHGDESGIQQLVSTLVDNALKYSNNEGTIRVTLRIAKKGVKLDVYNTTDEIEQANLDRLFDRFYRADSSRSRDTGGYGIGLSIAKSIVESHHGKISVKSEDGKSICFTVRI